MLRRSWWWLTRVSCAHTNKRCGVSDGRTSLASQVYYAHTCVGSARGDAVCISNACNVLRREATAALAVVICVAPVPACVCSIFSHTCARTHTHTRCKYSDITEKRSDIHHNNVISLRHIVRIVDAVVACRGSLGMRSKIKCAFHIANCDECSRVCA